ncbi:restriction endonuclease subunit S [Acinetobacter sp. CIP 102129]|uniref:restriction endonuclease subunit S n=1 Tax=Acinetobacter sp. CIP 102129 TaxID=1144664 RepID=UPI0002CDCCF6|nr:restriction endonuclease subunit S [Acinetobacter sp. CIP 102129]ENU85784.1 hypothetical protein F973_02006 [Acinetobacter sp. CIP 102129]
MATPKLRFKEFDGDWNKNTIGNFVLNYKGGASLTPADFVEYSDCEVIPKKAISSGGLLQLDKVVPTFCTLEFFNSNQNYIVDSEYLITTLRDLVPSGPSIGYIVKYESNKKYILAQGVYGFRIKNDLNRDFLIQFSNTSKFRLHMQSIMVGSTQVHIRNQDYFSTELYTPSLLEQTKIATFLSAVDEKISQLTQKHELLSQYKQGMMQKLFSQQIRFKADDGSEFGEWEEKILKDLFPKIRNGFVGVATPYYVNYGVKYLQGKNIKNGKIDATGLIFINQEFHQKKTNSILKTNDILMVQSGHVGECAVVTEDYDNANCHALLVLSPKSSKLINSKFVVYYFYSEIGKKKIALIKTGNTIEHILASDIKEVALLFPCLEEQTKIANFLSAIDQKNEVVAQKIEQAKQWKKGLLQQMFV